ncbi:MAG: transposase [Arenicella sp.]|jgi:transposase
MEACGEAHHLARKPKEFGYTPKRLAAKFVKPYFKSNKNNFLDAEAIWEAIQQPNMRFLTPRSPEQQTLGAQVKFRESLDRRRNAAINQVHAFILEFGIEYPKGRQSVFPLNEIVSLHESALRTLIVVMLYRIAQDYRSLCEEISNIEEDMNAAVRNDEKDQRLLKVQGGGHRRRAHIGRCGVRPSCMGARCVGSRCARFCRCLRLLRFGSTLRFAFWHNLVNAG